MAIAEHRGSQESNGPGIEPRVVVASILTITVAILPGFLPGALAVQFGSSLGIAEAGIGLVVGAFFGTSALVSPRLGRIVERLGWGSAMRISAIGAALTLLATPLVAQSMLTLGIVTMAGGVALALAHPAVNLGLARCTAVERQGLAFGFKHAAIPAATIIAGLGLPFIAIPFGWQWVYVLGAGLAVVAALLTPLKPRTYEVERVEIDNIDSPDRQGSSLSLLVTMAVGAGLGIFGMAALAVFLVPYAVEVGSTEASAGILLAIGSGLGILTRLVAGWTIDRRTAGGFSTISAFLALGSIGIGLVAIGTEPLIVIGSLIAFTFGWGWSGIFTFAVVQRNLRAPAAATGVTMTGVYVGSAVGPAVFGLVAEASFTAAWVIMSVALALGALLMIVVLVSERNCPLRA